MDVLINSATQTPAIANEIHNHSIAKNCNLNPTMMTTMVEIKWILALFSLFIKSIIPSKATPILLNICFNILKFCRFRCSWERNYITDVAHPGDK